MTTSTRTHTTNGKAPDDARLTQSHADTLIKESGIDPKVAEKRGYWSAICDDDLKQIGFHGAQRRAPALVIPVWSTAGKVTTYQIRPDNPRGDDRGVPRKYETRQGDSMVIDVHPFVRMDLRHQDAPLYITEGIKKADAAVSRDLCCIALMGVTCWRGRNPLGGTAALPDWNDIVLSDRDVYIVYDSDAATKPGVMRAEVALGRWLETRGAKVRIVRLPPGPNGKKVGLDDWLAAGHDADRLPELAKSLDDVAKQLKARGNAYTSADYLEALAMLGYTFRMNACDNSIEVNGERLEDPLMAKIRAQMRDAGLDKSHQMEDAYIAAAYDNKFHPVRDYLNSLEWDGERHIARLAAFFEDDHLPVMDQRGNMRRAFELFFTRWMVGAVAKALAGEQNIILVLDGEQGIGKSEFVKWLCTGIGMKYFTEDAINPNDKDHQLKLLNYFIWEVGELGATIRRADQEALKAFITKEWVTVRPSYGRNSIHKPAVASHIGTYNSRGSAGYLNDPSGSRRYLNVRLKRIDWAYKELDVDQLWAEAVALYRDGEPWRLGPDEQTEQQTINEEYKVENLYAQFILKYYDVDPDADWFEATVDIVQTLQMQGARDGTQSIAMRLPAAMDELGLCKRPLPPHGAEDRRRGYLGLKRKPGMEEENLP